MNALRFIFAFCVMAAVPRDSAQDFRRSLPHLRPQIDSALLRNDRTIEVRGVRLTNTRAELVGPGSGVRTPLTAIQSEPTIAFYSVGRMLSEGVYTLTIANQAGGCSATLSVVQGEPGSVDAAGNQILTSINQTLDADPSLSVSGTFAGRVTPIYVQADVNGTSRSIRLRGIEYSNANATGLYLVVIDLSNHSVIDIPVTGNPSFRTKQNFAPNQQAGLVDTLNFLNEQQVVILASLGDVSGMLSDVPLQSKLIEFGASPAVGLLSSGAAFVLIGQKGLQPGQAIELTEGAERSSLAKVATAAVDRGVWGFRNLFVNTNNVANNSVTANKLAPDASQRLYKGPPGCDGILTMQTTCQTLLCSTTCGSVSSSCAPVSATPVHNFWSCATPAVCDQTGPQTCDLTTTPAGWMVK